jgi:hypothetical protein
MPSTDTKPELTAKASMAQPVSQPAVYANGLMLYITTVAVCFEIHTKHINELREQSGIVLILNLVVPIVNTGP